MTSQAGLSRTSSRRRNRPGLHLGLGRDDIVRATLRLARETGLERVTIAGLCADLNVTPPTVYHHVRNKQELLALAAEAVLDGVPLPDPDDGDWTDRVVAVMVAARAALRTYRGLASYLVRHEQPRASLRLDEYVLTQLRVGGLSPELAATVFRALATFSTGETLREALLPDTPVAGVRHRARFFPRHVDDAEYPYAAEARQLLLTTSDDPFEHDLRLLLRALTHASATNARRAPADGQARARRRF